MAVIDEGLEPHGLRLAKCRNVDRLGRHDHAVLDALRATTTHPTAGQLYEAVRARFPRVGQATVYRALTRLLAAGLVVDVGRDALGRHYDARTERHDHTVCSSCGRVFDLPAQPDRLPPEVLAPLAEAARQVGMRVSSYEVRVYGLCAACDDQRQVSENTKDNQNSASVDRAHPRVNDPHGTRQGVSTDE